MSVIGSPVSIERLRGRITGRVIIPGEAGYDESRTVFMGAFDRRPALVMRPANADDVRQIVGFAREGDIELAVRSGGHSGAGHSTTDGGVLLDLRDMKALDVDAAARTAWAETGLTAGEYSAALGAHGLGTGFGDTGSVGIGGITLGGGIGYLTRKYGLTIDSLIAADIVTADGELVRADAESHPDLFWAIRGGGGNFGVATRFQFRLHPVDQVVGGMLLLPATAEVIADLAAIADAAPEELSLIANVMPAPPLPFVPEAQHGKLSVLVLLCYAGDVDAGQAVVDSLRKLAPPIVDMVRPMRYPEIFPPEDPSYRPLAVARTLFLQRIDRHVASSMLEYLEASDAVMRVAQFRILGGAMARIPHDATAFAHRASRILVSLAAFYTGPSDRSSREQWVLEFADALQQGDRGVYVNFMGEESPDRVRAAYPGTTWTRLAAIKARYDPDNVFRLNHNVPPVGSPR